MYIVVKILNFVMNYKKTANITRASVKELRCGKNTVCIFYRCPEYRGCYGMSLQMSDVICDKAPVLGSTIKDTPCLTA